jgi:PIN domain nuclease of toxin-antitoxin system
VASIWEMAIKHSVGKLSFGTPFTQFIEQEMRLNSMDLLPIEIGHINIVSTLPLHNRDPFDRLLISQAIVENMPILSVDIAFDAYPIQRIW